MAKLPELTLWWVGGGPGLYLSLIVGKSFVAVSFKDLESDILRLQE